MSNRAELVRRLIAYKAAVKVIEAGLKDEGRLEHDENGTAATYRMAYATVAGSSSRDRIEITDLEQFLGYMARRNPTEVYAKQTLVVRNPDWLAQVKDALAAISRDDWDAVVRATIEAGQARDLEAMTTGRAVDVDGTLIPGAVFVPGGTYVTTSVTPNSTARRRAAEAAKKGVLEGDWSALERAIADPGYLVTRDPDEPAEERVAGRPLESTPPL